MSTTPRTVADFETQLSTAIAIGATSFSIQSANDDDGVALPAGLYCFTIDNGSSVKEFLMGQLSGTSVTSVQSVSRQGALTSGAVRAHRVGASVIITDFLVLKRIADILSGDDTLDGSSPLSYDTQPTLSDGKELATVAYVLSVVAGGTVNFSSQTISATAGESLTGATTPVRVYFKESDSRWWKVDTDDTTTYLGVKVGFAISTATAGNSVTIQLSGIVSGFTGLTTNTKYYGSTTGGAIGTSVTNDFAGWDFSTTQLLMAVHNQELNLPTVGEKQALAGGSTFGTPSSSNKYITQDYNSSATGLPVVRNYGVLWGDSTTRFDITNPTGTTFRYTYDGTGTNPSITALTAPIGYKVNISSPNMSVGNRGSFTITGSGNDYFEVTNASGNVDSNQTLGTNGYLQIYNPTWTKPSGLKYLVVETQGGGGGSGGSTNDLRGTGGGGGGGYARKIIPVASLGSTETVTVGLGGLAGVGSSSGAGGTGVTSSFGSLLSATGGVGSAGATATEIAGGVGGVGVGGDVNIQGGTGGYGFGDSVQGTGGAGGSSFLGGSLGTVVAQASSNIEGKWGCPFGGGASGVASESATGDQNGGFGGAGNVIVTEYYS